MHRKGAGGKGVRRSLPNISILLYHTIRMTPILDSCACRKRKLRESSVNLNGWMIIRVNFLGLPQLPLRFRHPTTSMHFATRCLLPLTRCKPAQYTSKRGFHAFQCVPRLKPWLGASPLRVLRSDVHPFACRRMFHTSFCEPSLALWVILRKYLLIIPESAARHGHVTRPKPGTG